MKKVLVLNAGSSSIKYQLFEMPAARVLARGMVEKIGEEGSQLKHEVRNAEGSFDSQKEILDIPDHHASLKLIADRLTHGEAEQLLIEAVGHRVVHGGEKFSQPTLVDEKILNELKAISHLAPLHNPANLLGIEVAHRIFPEVPQVAVFDTAFHQSIPEAAYRYALPNHLYHEHGIRVYGFHGTSHAFVAREAANFLGREYEDFNAITLHLGNGCSMAAIRGGQSVDTTMGLTPLAGLMMGTRSGDIDPSLIFFMHNHLNMSLKDIDRVLNKESGLKGVAGEQDLRNIVLRHESGDVEATLAIEMYVYRIRKYLGAYLAVLGPTDAIIFTGGVGENSALIRQKVCQDLEHIGLKLDDSHNQRPEGGACAINAHESRVKVLVVPTNEELEIARQSLTLLEAATW